MARRDDDTICGCGSTWFRLTAEPGQPEPAVTMDGHGRVTAYSGTAVCAECGAAWSPERARLRAVQ